MSNTIKTETGAEVYESKIQELADDYISDLDDDEEIQKSMIRRNPIFKGMLKYIFINLFKIGDNDIRYNNKNSNIDYSNIYLLNTIWDIYTKLCYKYMQNPTLLNFSMLTGIAHETLTDWTNGNYRDNGGELGSSHRQSAKRWLKECESAAYDVALSGNPGGMFILKANYGYTEAPQQIQIVGQDQHKSIEQIAAEHAVKGITDNTNVIDIPDDDL